MGYLGRQSKKPRRLRQKDYDDDTLQSANPGTGQQAAGGSESGSQQRGRRSHLRDVPWACLANGGRGEGQYGRGRG